MMNARLRNTFTALLAVAAVGACDDPSAPVNENDAARLHTTASHVFVDAGGSQVVQAYLQDALGTPLPDAVAYTACNANISVADDTTQSSLEPGEKIVISGVDLGRSCVVVTGGSFEDTVQVTVVPNALDLAGDEVVLSGSSSALELAFLNAAGTAETGFDLDEVTFSSQDTTIAVVDATGVVTGRAPGTVGIVATLNPEWGAQRTTTFNVEIIPGDFAGTATPAAGPSGTEVTFEAGASAPAFDTTTVVTFTIDNIDYTVYPFSTSDDNTLITQIPFGTPAGAGIVTFTGLGPDEVALSTSFEVTESRDNDEFGANDPFLGEPPTLMTLPIEMVAAIDGAAGEENDGYYVTVPEDASYDVFLDWTGSSDLDVLILSGVTGQFDACTFSVATGNHPETTTCTLAAGPYYIIINDYAHAPVVSNYYLRVAETPPEE